MTVQFIPEISLGNMMVLIGVVVVFIIALRLFGRRVDNIETNVRKIEDIIEHRDFKKYVIEVLDEVQQIKRIGEVLSIGKAHQVDEVGVIEKATAVGEVERIQNVKGSP